MIAEANFSGVTICAAFDSGNCARAEQTAADEFAVWTAPDCAGTEHEKQYKAWFSFAVRGVAQGRTLTFVVNNMNCLGKLFKHDMRPVYRYLPAKPKWARIPMATTQSGTEKGSTNFVLTFKHRFECTEADTAQFAFCFPLSYTDTMARLSYLDHLFGLPPAAVLPPGAARVESTLSAQPPLLRGDSGPNAPAAAPVATPAPPGMEEAARPDDTPPAATDAPAAASNAPAAAPAAASAPAAARGAVSKARTRAGAAAPSAASAKPLATRPLAKHGNGRTGGKAGAGTTAHAADSSRGGPNAWHDTPACVHAAALAAALSGSTAAAASSSAVARQVSESAALAAVGYSTSMAPNERPDGIYYHRELLTRSLEGRRVDLITISATNGMLEATEAPINEEQVRWPGPG